MKSYVMALQVVEVPLMSSHRISVVLMVKDQLVFLFELVNMKDVQLVPLVRNIVKIEVLKIMHKNAR